MTDAAFDAESRWADAVRAGSRADLRDDEARRPVLRASVLTGILRELGASDRSSVVWVVGGRVTGRLDLGFAEIGAPIRFEECEFDEAPDLSWARLRYVSFTRCRLPGLTARNAVVEGDLSLTDSRVTGTLDLRAVRVAGDLVFDALRVSGSGGEAVVADNAVLGGHLSARAARFDGSVRMYQIRCTGIDVDEAVFHTPGGWALTAESVGIDGGFFARGCVFDGEVRMRHAKIGDALTFTGSTLRNPGAVALRLDRATLGGGLWLGDGATTVGEVRAISAHIGRTLSLVAGVFEHPDEVALRFDAVTVEGTIDGHRGLRVRGALRLEDAVVSGPIRLEGATLDNRGGDALAANGLRAGSLLNCCDGFTATGSIRLTGAQVGTRLCFDDATLADGGRAVGCWRLQASEIAMRWSTTPGGSVDLRYAHVGVLRDDPATWPDVLLLDGLTYDILEPRPGVAERIGWLSRDPDGHHRQPYEQLATVLRGQGRGEDARRILLARQRRDTRRARPGSRLWGYLQDTTVGYGYRPQRAAVIFAALLVLGAVLFGVHPPAPAEPAKAPSFNPLVYTLDLLLPVLDFGQQSAFLPTGAYQWASYAFIVAGVILATTIAAGLTRSLRRT
ncbi:hypothetical protein O7598_10215 [Micromonospora sp. WMMC241]|uniref:hypothetical protein n=1 Tax=Micromonospora sp. WMMC241 TaxID=3015159 RepID=UPI0022B6924E|nr:hypothetical protein [Micromonospora sp. WMMC241]MCZ7436765.1 hypothetical protein [Micromonospora sp. WMMC241]